MQLNVLHWAAIRQMTELLIQFAAAHTGQFAQHIYVYGVVQMFVDVIQYRRQGVLLMIFGRQAFKKLHAILTYHPHQQFIQSEIEDQVPRAL